MKKLFSVLIVLTITFPFIINAQVKTVRSVNENAVQKVDRAYQESVIQKIEQLLNEFYVFPDVAKESGKHLRKQYEAGFFNKYEDLKLFSEALTGELQSVNKDKHMRVVTMPAMSGANPNLSVENQVDNILKSKTSLKNKTGGFFEAKKLENNIGYLDIRFFPPAMEGAPFADAFMKLLNGSDALIIDLRKHGGGSPDMVQYLCSYFFDKKIHLNSIYNRISDETREYWVLDEVNGEKMPEVPLFILTGIYTFSGAEEFAYNMQTQKRAMLVGETTGGGANPGGLRRIDDRMAIFVPDGRAINPVTNTNWEGTGVIPEVKIKAEESYEKAVELANIAAEEYKKNKYAKGKELLMNFFTQLEKVKDDSFTSRQLNEIYEQLKNCVEKRILNEFDINNLGYAQLRSAETLKAEVIFKSNTLLFPNSANTYDSYAEALAVSGKNELALVNYEKAVKIAAELNEPNKDLFKDNLEKFKRSLTEK